MILDSENAQHLKPWLIRTLEPICDAEPGALADYVLALLKHNGPESELRKEMHAQLDEFLEKECKPFLDTLFTALRTKSYLPYSSTTSSGAPSDSGIPIPLDALLTSGPPTSPRQSRKRALEDGDRNGQGTTKMARTNGGDGQYSRYSARPGEERPSGGWREQQRFGTNGRDDGSSANGRVYAPPEQQKRGVCRDYHNTGYCGRGAFCKYSHDESAMVPSQMFAMHSGGMPFIPMFPGQQYGGGVNSVAAYDPHEAQVDIRHANGRLPLHARPGARPDIRGLRSSGELPVIQDLTPNVPPTDLQPNPNAHLAGTPSSISSPAPPYLPESRRLDPPNMAMQVDGETSRPPRPPPQSGQRYGNRGPIRPGTFPSEAANFRPTERRKDKTLVMEKIPDDKLSLESVNDWFKRFGTVTNVAIDRPSSKALISFSSHEEAHAAWKSEDAVFNNRFVKLFWHRPLEGHGQLGSKMLAASAPVVAHLSAPTPPPTESPPVAGPSSRAARKQPAPSAAAASLAAKQQLLEKQIAEQKDLMNSLDKAVGQEKKDIMARLRKLSEEMVAAKAAEKESTPEISQPSAGDGASETAQDLKAKLERLKAEAASLGISEIGAPPYASRPYRGRGGRGSRAAFRGAGRGGPPRGSLKLDNRPKQLLVKGVDPTNLQALQDWYETTGQVESVTKQDNGDVVVSFNSREAAEQGLGKGSNIPAVGTVQISWVSGVPPVSRPPLAAKTTTAPASEDVDMADSLKVVESTPRRTQDEEEEIASGWGGDGEDGMGML